MESAVWPLLAGKRPSKTPVAAWRHFYRSECDPIQFAEATLSHQRSFPWDFIKLNTRATFFGEPFGLLAQPGPDDEHKGPLPIPPYRSVEDLLRLSRPAKLPRAYAEQLQALRVVRQSMPHHPIVLTLFNPISVLGDLVEPEELLLEAMQTAGSVVFQALDAISQVLLRYAQEGLRQGADGLFYATTEWASALRIPWEWYQRFALPYDQLLLDAVREAPFNILHVCGHENFLPHLWQLPVAAFSWDSTDPTNLSLAEAARMCDRILIGGIDREFLCDALPGEVERTSRAVIEEAAAWPFILAPSCAYRPSTPLVNLRELVSTAQGWTS